MNHKGLPTGEAAKYISRHPKTLQRMDRAGVLPAHRTITGRRYWLRNDLDVFLGKTRATTTRTVIAYCRVSSSSQRNDLKNQRSVVEDFVIARGIANTEFVEEIGGGLNFKRKKFLALVDKIVAGEVSCLILAHKDRLVRFGFELLEHLCDAHNCELLIINSEKLSPEAEMVQDLMTIVHCFSSRLYGLRNYRKSLKKALES
mgnify:CR=1 FL=1|jgi:putative resolvase